MVCKTQNDWYFNSKVKSETLADHERLQATKNKSTDKKLTPHPLFIIKYSKTAGKKILLILHHTQLYWLNHVDWTPRMISNIWSNGLPWKPIPGYPAGNLGFQGGLEKADMCDETTNHIQWRIWHQPLIQKNDWDKRDITTIMHDKSLNN